MKHLIVLLNRRKKLVPMLDKTLPIIFLTSGKRSAMPKNAEKQIENSMLTRYACYLTYFAVQTRRAGN